MIAITIEAAAFFFLTIGVLVTVLCAMGFQERLRISVSFLKGPLRRPTLAHSDETDLVRPTRVLITQTTVANARSPLTRRTVRPSRPTR